MIASRFKFPWIISFFLCVLVIILSVVAWNRARVTTDQQEIEQRELRTQTILLVARKLFSSLQDAESGQRGYVITQLADYLEPYDTGRIAVVHDLDRLQDLTDDNPIQRSRVSVLRTVIADKLTDLTRTIAMVRNGAQSEAVTAIMTRNGKILMDRARAFTAAIRAEEEQRLISDRAAAAAADTRDRVLTDIFIVVSILTLIGGGVGAFMVRQFLARVRLSETLIAAEKRFRLLIARTPAALAMFDTNMRYLAVNERFITDYNLNTTPAALLGRGYYEVFPEIPSHWRIIHQRVLRGEKHARNEETFERTDGSTEWVRWEMVPWHEPDGSIGGAILFSEVLTGRKLALHAARISQARLQAVFDTVPIGIVIGDAPSGRIVAANRQIETLFRHPVLSVPHVQPYTWVSFHADGRRVEAHEYPLARALAGEERPELSVLYRRGDGSHGWMRLIAAPIRHRDEITGAVVVVIDIEHEIRTKYDLEQRVLEEVQARIIVQRQLTQVEKLTALGQLAGGIAHDFNNVIQTVSGAASLIGRNIDKPDTVKRLTGMVEDAVRRGASVTRRLLAFARRDELRAEAVDLGEVLYGIHEILRHTLGAGVTVTLDVPEQLPVVLADRGQLETVIINLAGNASDAMLLRGGTVTLSAESETILECHAEGLQPGDYVRLTVTDTGAGMDEATLAHVMEPFFTTKPKGQGIGLGLPMARGFAQQSNGGLSITSRVGQGTIVTLWLPVMAESLRLTAHNENIAMSGQCRILVVDDELLVREVLAEQLSDMGHHVTKADSGKTALACLDSTVVDLMITDLSMPEMDGITLIRAVQTRFPRMPAILLTGYAGDAATLAVGGVVEGSFTLLRKPITYAQLHDLIAALLETMHDKTLNIVSCQSSASR